MFCAERTDSTVRILSMHEFTAADMPESFDDSPSDPVTYSIESGVKIDDGNAFLPGTNVSIAIVEKEKADNAMSSIAREYVVFEITAEKDGMLYQPRNSVTVTFPIPESYSNDVALYYMNNKGIVTALDATVDLVNRRITTTLDHFSTYILADKSTDPSILIPGDVNNDGKANIRDAATILQYLEGKKVECLADNIDANGDGKIDAADAEYILKNVTNHPDAVLNMGLSCVHDIKYIDAIPSTYVSEGQIEHWICTKCNLLFKDANAKILITKAATSAPVLERIPSEGLNFELNSDGTGYILINQGSCIDLNIVIPSTYEGLPVTEIGRYAFRYSNIQNVFIPESVKTINEDAFFGCNELTSVSFTSGLETIALNAFRNCTALESLVLPEGLKTIGNYAFASSGLKNISFPKSVETIGTNILERTDLQTIKVHEDNPFYSSAGNCLIEKATKTIIVGCANTEIPTDGSVTTIGENAFYDCESLKNIVIPEGVQKIDKGAFALCMNLETVSLPASVTEIVNNPFERCIALKSFTLDKNNTVFHSAGDCLIETATKTLVMGCQTSVIPADGSVTVIGNGAFSAQIELKNIVIPECVTKIGEGAFAYCMGLTSINIPEGIEEISASTFYGCTEITDIIIPNTVKKIGDCAFGTMGLKSITIPASVTEIEGNPFEECLELESITVDAGNTKYHAAGNCLIETATKTLITGLAYSTIPTDGSVTVIGDRAFFGQNTIYAFTLPNCITKIGSWSFGNCSTLQYFTFDGTEEEWNKIEKDASWNRNSAFSFGNGVTFTGVHTHSTVTVPGTPAGERTFGKTDYVYCTTCSEVISEQTLILPLGIENPDYYASNWGYEYLGTLPNGEALQKFYKALDEEVSDFHVNTDRVADKDGYLNPVRYDVFGLSDAESRMVYSIYKDDHPLYYWISISSAIYPGTSFLVMVDEEYSDSAVRAYYNDLIYDVAADYLKLTINETSEYQICWALHDAICLNSKYAYKSDGITPEDASWAHNIIGIIEKNTGVCESYTEIFGLLLNFAGVENIRVSGKGNGGGHAWNLVKLDNGEWYWYDLTWDDRDTNDVYEIFQGYAAVTDYQEVTVKIGGGSFEPLYFLQKHTPGTNHSYGVNYNPVLPARATDPFTTSDTMIYNTFTVEGTTYQIIRFDTVYCSPYLGIGSTPPDTITYNGREYKVIVG